jgi:phosphoribosyl-AMP cyclohydrolase
MSTTRFAKLWEAVKFDAAGLVPAVIADAADNRPLTLCYMNREALEKTLETGLVHVFRRSKGRLMLKGEVSGHTQHVKQVAVDCEGNSLLITVEQRVAACHAGYRSCYYRVYDPATDSFVVREERVFDPDKVY